MKKLLLATLCLLPLALPSAAHAEPARLQHLTTVVGDFQSGFAYWAECGNLAKEKASHPRFVANGDAAFVAYGREAQATHPDAHPQDLIDAVLRKTNSMKAEIVAQSKAPDFCTSEHAKKIEKTIRMFDSQSLKQMTAFLDNLQ
jgi:hypothetical protein